MTEESKENSPKMPKRCQAAGCKKNIKIMRYQCRCGKYFCISHVNAEAHACTYDYRGTMLKDISGIADSMKCVAKKIDVI